MQNSIKFTVSVLALACAAAAPAYAADAAVAADEVAAETTPPDSTGLTDIVVTATKRETNLQKTPISISVMGSDDIKKRHVQSLFDLADGAVPSLRVAPFEARQNALTIGIRGIVPLDANQPAREQGVGIYIDGVYLGRQHGINSALFDVERIEVLKGPQGTLFGRNTEGGALSIVARAPTGEFGGRISSGVGNYGAVNADAHIDLPTVAGFSIKLDAVYSRQDPTTENPLAGQAGFNMFNRRGFRAAVRWQPADGITNDFAYDNAYSETTPFYTQLLNYNPNNCAPSTAAQPVSADVIPGACVLPGSNFSGGLTGTVRPLLPGVVVNGTTRMRVADIGVPMRVSIDKAHGFTNTFKWKISPEIEFRSITAWRGVTADQWDNVGGAHRPPVVNLTASCTAAAPCPFSRYSLADLRQRQFSQEFQAVGSIGNIDYVAGLYYFNERVSDDAATPNSMGAIATVVNGVVTGATYVPIPFCTANTPLFVGKAVNGCSIDRASQVVSKSYAAFAQLTWNPSEVLHITAGGRYTRDKKRGALTFSRGINYTDPANAAIVATNGYTPLDEVWNRFNPMVTVAYDVNPDVHVYAKYATGYRAGGASSRTSDYRAFDPEDVQSYELGFKADFLNRRARINVAAYMMDRQDSQVDLSTIQPTATGNFNNLVTFNAPGTTKIRGVEADLTLKPVDNLTLGLSYAYTYFKVPPVTVVYEGLNAQRVVVNRTSQPQNFYIVFTPSNAASGSLDYAIPVGDNGTEVRLHLDANYSQATQAFDQFATKNDASFIVNGRLALADIPVGGDTSRTLTVSAWVRNMFDMQYVFRRDPSNSLPQVQSSTALVGTLSNTMGDYGNFNAPRTFGIEAAIKF
ncbi:TonB-dependent receptor [Novosphingobium piscinae]|uniref:TonB-dependent receptor n=1 Tax=Novosphingobium piscinae TaxID=1507448 RepID=A0A7X1FXD7_9SPHN|nr:TonB-dependent receptor [Novosphingobium piscinae]MBC2668781.1 TonB-dependent receptor [Novosphingobium piscinae]